MARRRAQWTKRQSGIDPRRLVFIDETWTKTNMEPLRGWAPKGERLVAKVPHGHWQTMTFVAALRHDRIEAPWLIDGPIDGQGFRTYVEKELAPTLKPGDLVIMDNLGSHKGEAVRQAIRSAGAKLFFLPKYSPDLNPIEQVFAKFKHLLRKAAARTLETVLAAIGELLDAYTPEECANYLKNAGYGQTRKHPALLSRRAGIVIARRGAKSWRQLNPFNRFGAQNLSLPSRPPGRRREGGRMRVYTHKLEGARAPAARANRLDGPSGARSAPPQLTPAAPRSS